MIRRLMLSRRLATGLATLALAAGWAGTTRADVAYGFASETISGLTITPTITQTGALIQSTTSSTTQNGSGPSKSDATDVAQSYQGGLPQAPENLFTRYAPGTPTPVSPVGDFTRGDAQIVPNTSGAVVAESYLGNLGNETGKGGLIASFAFTPTVTSALTLTYNYSNRAYVFQTGGGTAQAAYNFDITIKNAAGAVVFSSDTPNTNISLTAPPPGGEIIRTGSETVTSASLTAGQTYSLTFTENANTSVTVNAVPEPGPIALAAIGGLTVAAGAYRRRRAARV